MRRGPHPRTTAGFTLIELMFALVVLSIAILGMATVLAGTSRWQNRTESHMDLTGALEAKLEQLRDVALAGGPDTTMLVPGGSLTTDVAGHADSVFSPGGRWVRRRWEVVSGPGDARTVTMRGFYSEPGDHRIGAREIVTILLLRRP